MCDTALTKLACISLLRIRTSLFSLKYGARLLKKWAGKDKCLLLGWQESSVNHHSRFPQWVRLLPHKDPRWLHQVLGLPSLGPLHGFSLPECHKLRCFSITTVYLVTDWFLNSLSRFVYCLSPSLLWCHRCTHCLPVSLLWCHRLIHCLPPLLLWCHRFFLCLTSQVRESQKTESSFRLLGKSFQTLKSRDPEERKYPQCLSWGYCNR